MKLASAVFALCALGAVAQECATPDPEVPSATTALERPQRSLGALAEELLLRGKNFSKAEVLASAASPDDPREKIEQSLIRLYHLTEYYPADMTARSTIEKLVQRLQELNAAEHTATVRTLDDASKPALPHCLAAIKGQPNAIKQHPQFNVFSIANLVTAEEIQLLRAVHAQTVLRFGRRKPVFCSLQKPFPDSTDEDYLIASRCLKDPAKAKQLGLSIIGNSSAVYQGDYVVVDAVVQRVKDLLNFSTFWPEVSLERFAPDAPDTKALPDCSPVDNNGPIKINAAVVRVFLSDHNSDGGITLSFPQLSLALPAHAGTAVVSFSFDARGRCDPRGQNQWTASGTQPVVMTMRFDNTESSFVGQRIFRTRPTAPRRPYQPVALCRQRACMCHYDAPIAMLRANAFAPPEE